jgi:hypothetical protein
LYFKKGQGLSLNVIIVAAIALIVLIVLWAVFTGRMGQTVSELPKCRGKGSATPCPTGYVNEPNTNYPYCCIAIPGGGSATVVNTNVP